MADPNLVERILGVIRQHESGGNYQAVNPHGGSAAASGAYQMILDTWRGYARQAGVDISAYPRAADAPPEVQDQVARAAVERILDANGGNPDAVWASWYTGGYDPTHLDYIPAEFDAQGRRQNTVTVRTYIEQANNMLAGGTGAGSGGTSDPTQDPAVQAFLKSLAENPDALVRQRFPAYALYLSDPEMGPILRQAAAENWDSARLQNAILNTNWWRTTSDAQRQWDQLASTDPAAADRQRNQKLLEVSQQFAGMGYTPDQTTLWRITNDSLRNGWNSQEVANAILTALPDRYQAGPGGFGGGSIQGTIQSLRSTAADYFMPLSDDTAYDWAKRIAAGTLDQSAVNGMLANWAKNNYSFYAADIDRGATLKDLFAPLQQQVATIMGQSPETIDILNDPFWHQLTQVTDQAGVRRAPTIQDAQALARSNPGYKYTADATNRGASVTMALQKVFQGGG